MRGLDQVAGQVVAPLVAEGAGPIEDGLHAARECDPLRSLLCLLRR